MGWGHYCIASKALGFNVYGAELSQKRIDFAKTHGIKVIEDISLIKNNFFQFINTDQVIEHVSDPGAIIKDLKRILHDDGILKIAVPNSKKSLKTLGKTNWKPSKDALHPLEHINCFTNKTLLKLAENNGFIPFTPPKSNHLSCLKFFKELLKVRMATSLFFKKA